MNRIFTILCGFCISISATVTADTVLWSGDVNSDGTPSSTIKLELGKKYQIKVSGTINLGKWWKEGVPLTQDACYEFNPLAGSTPNSSIKNSLNISVCDGDYHLDHIYRSLPFVAAQSSIHFWIHDIDYSDNSGTLQVQVIKLTDE